MLVSGEFERNGWVRLPDRVEDSLVESLKAVLAPRWPGPRDERWTNAWHRNPVVARLASHPMVLRALIDLYGRRPVPFQTLNFQRGSQQSLHADNVHFDSLPTGWMCGVWVALEDVGADQGPVQLVTGSHRLTQLRPELVVGDPDRFDYARYEELVAETIAGMPVEPFLCERGEVLVWHGDLVHGGAAQLDPTASRWSQVTHHVFEGVTAITPMRSDLAAQHYVVRDPLIDVGTRRRVPPMIDGRAARFEHLRGGRRRVLGADDPGPSGAAAVRSRLLGLAHSARARVVRSRHS